MDPRDHPSDLVSDADCAACGRSVPSERVRLLARRDDLAFAELPCERCGSVSLAIFVGRPDAIAPSTPPTASRGAAIGPDDVLDMHLLLAGWTGDLHTLVGGPGRPNGPAGGT